MSGAGQNLVKWLTRMLADVTEAGSIGRFELIHKVEGEHAELKRDQIHAYGPDASIPRCKGSMSARIEPAE